MGILRKLAELVVEFPEDAGAAGSADKQDVLASIEQVRGEIEAELSGQEATLKSAVAEKPKKPTLPPPRPKGDLPPSQIQLPAVLGINEVYDKAGLAPEPDGFDIYTVEKMLSDPEIADLPIETRARSVRMALRSMGRELHDLIQDAAKRDQALEIYEEFVQQALQDVSVQVTDANARLQQEIDEFVRTKTALMEANKQALEQARAGFEDYRRSKAAEEQRLFNTVAPFVAPGQNPVQLGRQPDQERGS